MPSDFICDKDGALESEGAGGLRHVPAVFLQLSQDKFALVALRAS